jgi:hypothetical protein
MPLAGLNDDISMLQVIFDDTVPVPEPIRAVVGVDHFGGLVFQRRTRLEAMRALALEAGWPPIIHLCGEADVAALVESLRREDDNRLYLVCPSHLVPVCGRDTLETFLKQIEYSPSALHIPLNGALDRRGWTLMRSPLLRKFLARQKDGDLIGFFEQYGEGLVEVRDRLNLIDVSEERTLHDFLSGQFDARHFNTVERDEYTVIKRSRDRKKLKREYDFYRLVPSAMQMFFVQPFDFEDDGEMASYRMERVCVPDMALQWVHGAFQPQEFERFLQHIFHFIGIRSARRVDKAEAAAARDALYIDKVNARIDELKTLPAYARLGPLLDRACGGIDGLVARYFKLYEQARKRFPSRHLVIGHGDPCFSNIFYSKTNQYLKLVDPRGAESEADLYTDPYYDVAKLSHSIQGGYDFINHDKFDITVDEALRLRLAIEDAPPPWARKLFHAQLQKADFDPALTRLCEASLFISMLPLHIDRPRKVLAFAINATTILDGLSSGKETAP